MNRIKKSLVICLVIFVVLFCLSAMNIFAETVFLTATGGTMGGSTYPIAATISKLITDNLEDVVCSVQSTGGTLAQLQLIKRNESQLGLCDPAAADAFHGVGAFKDDKMPFLRTIVPTYSEMFGIIVAKNSGIKSLYDLKGKRVSIGAVGSGIELTCKEVFDVLGMTFNDVDARHLGSGEVAQSIRDKQIDAAILNGIDSAITELTSIGLIDILPVDDKIIAKLKAVYPKYSSGVIPAGMYKGFDEVIPTFAFWSALITREELPEDLIYAITAILYENKQDLVNTNWQMETMKPENLKELLIPLHPGAKKYYIDNGYSEYFNKSLEE